jgi:hypothetical protein
MLGSKLGIQSNTAALPLDTYPDAAAGFSLRKIRQGHSGYVVEVRRETDDVEANIAFDSNQRVSLDSLVTITAGSSGCDGLPLGNFVAASGYTDTDSLGAVKDAYVTTWYNQSVSEDHASQTSAGNQPILVKDGVLNVSNNLATLDCNSGRVMDAELSSSLSRASTDPCLWLAAYQLGSQTRQGIMRWGTTTTATNNLKTEMEPWADGAGVGIHRYGQFCYGPTDASIGGYTNQLNLIAWSYTGSVAADSIIYFQRDPVLTSGQKYPNPFTNSPYVTGSVRIAQGSLGTTNSKISEIILYPNNQTQNLKGLNENIYNYYTGSFL